MSGKAVMTKLGLTNNEAKTSLRNARRERFDFLGYSDLVIGSEQAGRDSEDRVCSSSDMLD
jgi:hypothetical protein